MKNLRVEITDFVDETRWRWRLLDQAGTFLADHEVTLNREDPEYGGYLHLPSFLRWNAGPDGSDRDERVMVQRVGRWIKKHAWGAIADTILDYAQHDPIAVLVAVPADAQSLLFRPFELPFLTESPSRPTDVSLIFDSEVCIEERRPQKQDVGDALRVLAIFSAPTDQVALNTRFERRELRNLIREVTLTGGRAVELRVLQYGVTRMLLENVLADGRGWDLIHFSGHGLPSGLVLEQEDGSTDVIQSGEFAALLRPVRDQLKLVTLSSCESGAVAAANAMERLGISRSDEGAEEDDADETHEALPAVAQSVADQIGCAVLAMRYPVEDKFAIDFSGDLYRGVLEHGQSLSRAAQMALRKMTADGTATRALSLATPALFGSMALDLTLEAPPAQPSAFDASATRLPYFEEEPAYFVGRIRPLARASAAFAPKSPYRTVVFHGMAGAGKTACALELAYRHEENRFEAMAWHRAPTEGQSIKEALANFAVDLEIQLEGLELAHVVNDSERLKRFLPRFRRLLAERSLLIVLDNVESLLTDDGQWRDERWGQLLEALTLHGGLSRLVLTTRVLPKSLRGRPGVLFEPIDSLSVQESALLAQQLPNLSRLMSRGDGESVAEGHMLVRRALEIVQGNPKLIELADRQASDPKRLEERIREADDAWSKGADLSRFFKTGEPDDQIGADDFLRVLESWTEGIVGTLSEDLRLAFQLLCCLEAGDRRHNLIELAWPPLWEELTGNKPPSDFSDLLLALADEGLIDMEHRDESVYRIHPAVEQTERRVIDATVSQESDTALSSFWRILFRRGSEQNETNLATQAGLSAAPYLLRRGRIEEVVLMLETVVTQDSNPNTIATALPHLHRAFELSEGPRDKRRVRTALVRARLSQPSNELTSEIRELIDLAYEEGDFAGVLVLRGSLFNKLVRIGHFREAKALLEEPLEPEVAAERGSWSRLADEGRRLRVMFELGEYEQVLNESRELLEQIEETDETQDMNKGTVTLPWNVREAVLSTARAAAANLDKYQLALQLNAAVHKSEIRRGAPELERAKTSFNDFSAFVALNRLEEAESLLQKVRKAAEDSKELHLLANVFDAWATLAGRKGHVDDAIAFNHRALHVSYALGNPSVISLCHHNLASHLLSAETDDKEFLTHALAELLIGYQTGNSYEARLHPIRRIVSRLQRRGLPGSFAELCQWLRNEAEVDFHHLFDRLPKRAESGDAAFAVVMNDLTSSES